MCRHEEFVAKLLPKPREIWRVLLVAITSVGKGRILNLCGSPFPALMLDLMRRTGRRGEEKVLEKGLCSFGSQRKFMPSLGVPPMPGTPTYPFKSSSEFVFCLLFQIDCV